MAESEFKYDVFISYNHKDSEWVVKTLLPPIQDAGLKVCIDFNDFNAGGIAILDIQNAIKQSRHILLVLTQNWLSGKWTHFESLIASTINPTGSERKIIPLLREDGIENNIPEFIAIRNWVDFTIKGQEAIAWKQLFSALGQPDAKIPGETKFDVASRNAWHLAHPYPMPPNFTGRAAELKMLDDWLADDNDRLFILPALGGFGKSALAWQWINTHVNPTEWTKLVWWSFYEGDASFEHFIEETLKYLKLEVPQGQRPQVDELLKAMQSQKILLIMDGFERALRAYSSMNAAYQGDEPKVEDNQLDCVNINAEIFLKSVCSLPDMKSKVLMTTRLTPRAVKPRGEFMLGCREEELTAMQKADAVEFFHKQKIQGTHTEIEAACAPYGYHPLSLRLLAGRILKDFENPGDIAVAQKFRIDGDLIQQKHHVLEVSYNSVPAHEQKLLSTIACFRSPVELKTLQSIAENQDTLDKDLSDLMERGLLHFDNKNKKIDLHPIVRRYAYERLTSSERTAAHTRLRDYFVAVQVNEQFQTLNNLAPVIELYHHTVRAGNLDDARILFRDRLHRNLYFQFGVFETINELIRALFIDGEYALPRLNNKLAQGWTLNALANSYSLGGQPRQAVPLFELSVKLVEEDNDRENLSIALGNMANNQFKIGNLLNSDSNKRRAIELSEESQNTHQEGVARRELGWFLSYRGEWDLSQQEFLNALTEFEENENAQAQGVTWAYRALYNLLLARRSFDQSKTELVKSAIQFAQRALEFAEEYARTDYPVETDFVRAHWLIGAANRLNSQLYFAEHHLNESLTRCRAINVVEFEANILLDLARLRYDQQNYEEAKSLAEEALLITERCGYVLQGADVNLFLAQYALEREQDKVKAKEYAETALKLAYCDGPPYYYKVAYHEAERMLEKL